MTRLNRYGIQDVLAIWVILPLVLLIPESVWAYALITLLLVPWLPQRWRQRPALWLWGFLLSALMLLVLVSPQWLAGENLVALTALLVVAKRFETHQARDLHAFLSLVFICSALSLIYWNSLWALLHLVVLMALILINTRVQSQSEKQRQSSTASLSAISLIMLWSLPLAITLFMLLPRIPGPLWNFGLVLGMPLSVFEQIQKVSLKATSNPLEQLLLKQQQDNELVLVAEFTGSAPLRSNLYWRGPVYYRYQDEQWVDSLKGTSRTLRLKTAHRDKNHYQQQLHDVKRPVSYQAKVSANNSHYLYALDVPASNVQESYITSDGQLLSIRSLYSEFSYEASSYLAGNHGVGSNPHQQRPDIIAVSDRSLSQEQHMAIGRLLGEWRPDGSSDVSMERVFETLAESPEWLPYPFRSEHEALKNHIGFYMLALNHAGIPARMVEGYRGGDLVAMTDFIVVRQKHRHIWLEIWDDQQGWGRFDIRDLVMGARLEAARPIDQSKTSNTTQAVVDSTSSSHREADSSEQSRIPEDDSSLFEALENWFLGYAPETLASPEKKSQTISGGNFNWLVWVFVVALLMVAVSVSYLLLGKRRRYPPLLTAWKALEQTLLPFGVHVPAHVCPSLLLAQLPDPAPSWHSAATELVNEYLTLRYGPDASSQQISQFHRKVVRFKGILQDIPNL